MDPQVVTKTGHQQEERRAAKVGGTARDMLCFTSLLMWKLCSKHQNFLTDYISCYTSTHLLPIYQITDPKSLAVTPNRDITSKPSLGGTWLQSQHSGGRSKWAAENKSGLPVQQTVLGQLELHGKTPGGGGVTLYIIPQLSISISILLYTQTACIIFLIIQRDIYSEMCADAYLH